MGTVPAPARGAALLLVVAGLLRAGVASDLSTRLQDAGLDPGQCYRVRDLSVFREDIRLYFTDGYLIFGRLVGDSPVTAVFVAGVQGGDAELLLLPPNKSERQSLAKFTGSPNLNEHFKAAVLLFTDAAYRELMEQIRAGESNRKSPEMGLALASEWNPTVRNLVSSFESRLVLDMLSGARDSHGLFYAAVQGAKLGNFDLVYDLRSRQQITVGQTAYRNERAYFDVWTAFESRSARSRTRPAAAPEFTVDDFRIEAALAPPDLRLDVVTRVKVKPSRNLAAFPFELSRRMKVASASVDGRPAEIFERESMRANLINDHGNYLFLVVPETPLEAGREYEFEFRHSGNVITDAGNKVYFVGSRGNWYPNRGLQFASFDVTFRYPKDLDLVAAGEIVSDSEEGERKATRRRTTAPVRMFGFNLGVYERVRITRGKDTVEVCANQGLERALQPTLAVPPITVVEPPAPVIRPRPGRPQPPALAFPSVDVPLKPVSPTARLRDLAADVASAMEFMSARFGPPPLPTLTVSPVPGTFGQGFPGMVYLSTLSYLLPDDRPMARLGERYKTFFFDLLYAHEVAHQWWGNVVASSGYQHDWLLEALANYSALMYLEKRKGPRALESVLDEYRDDLLEKRDGGDTLESSGPIALGARLETSLNPQAWRIIVYEKGSWILHMLRGAMGDERFASFLGELRRRYEWKTLDMEGFRALAAEFLPPKSPDPKLESFFDQWVYSTGIPALKVKHSISGKAPALKLTVTVEQSGVGDDFSAPVPVEIQFGGRIKPVTRIVRTSSEPAVFTMAVRQRPSKVVLDPGNRVLAVKN